MDTTLMSRPQPLSGILTANATLAAWDARRRREEALTQIVRRHLPRALAPRVRVGGADGVLLSLMTEAGAIAAIVRQRTPEILIALRSDGWEFTGIEVRVQVRVAPIAQPKLQRNQLDRETLRPLADLARRLPAGPLKHALARLLRRCE